MGGRLFYRDLSSFDGSDVGTMGKVVKLVNNFDSLYQYVTNEGRTFWFRSNMDAPKYKVGISGGGGRGYSTRCLCRPPATHRGCEGDDG